MEVFSYYIFWCVITGWEFGSSMSIDKRVNFTFMRAATLYQPWFKCRHLPRKSNCLGPGKLINWHFFHCHFAQSPWVPVAFPVLGNSSSIPLWSMWRSALLMCTYESVTFPGDASIGITAYIFTGKKALAIKLCFKST